jgi:hypothetical protein
MPCQADLRRLKMKNCAFQYATADGNIVKDTDLISRADAEQLWQEHIDLFKSDVEAGKTPEMAIWIDMVSDTNYHKAAIHWHGDDFFIKGGQMFSLVAVA